jgi:hypothetical protein
MREGMKVRRKEGVEQTKVRGTAFWVYTMINFGFTFRTGTGRLRHIFPVSSDKQMSLASHKCQGCGRFFTPTGLNSHTRQTRNDACRRLDRRKQANGCPQDFEGDLYGDDYGENDFPGFDAPLACLSPDGSGDEDDAIGDEDGWEPEPLDQPAGDADLDVPPPVIDNRIPSNRHESHSRLTQKPVIRLFNDRPDRNAGAPLPNQTKTGYETYQDALPNSNAVPNVWAPFASKIDWEVARWAKLRGPGSTALSELLRIEGVSALSSAFGSLNVNFLLAAQYVAPFIQLRK